LTPREILHDRIVRHLDTLSTEAACSWLLGHGLLGFHSNPALRPELRACPGRRRVRWRKWVETEPETWYASFGGTEMISSSIKAEVTLDRAKFERLEALALARKASVDELIREAVESHFGLVTQAERRADLDALGRLDLPVGSWEEMEAEIIRGATEG
jgi:hypothetical protein